MAGSHCMGASELKAPGDAVVVMAAGWQPERLEEGSTPQTVAWAIFFRLGWGILRRA